MTSLVGIRCSDGVVIGADSSATFGDGEYLRTIEQETERKIEIIGDRIIIAGTGFIGHSQRFCSVVKGMWDKAEFKDATDLEMAKKLAGGAVNDFGQTMTPLHLQKVELSALAAYVAKDAPVLCEFFGRIGFQPEVKRPEDLWFTSMGSGQPITDPFLALLRKVFWSDGPPKLQGGIFMALWALRHACELNTGGIKEPIRIATLAREKGKWQARLLDDDQLREQGNMVEDATRHMRDFRDVLEGKVNPAVPPEPQKPQA